MSWRNELNQLIRDSIWKIVAVPVVAQEVWVMGKNLCPDTTRITFAISGV